MELSIHQRVALSLLFITPITFAPVVQSTARPDAAMVIAWGVATVALMTLLVPLLLAWPPFRRLYGWTDAMSEAQRDALSQRNFSRYYQAAHNHEYPQRVRPYMLRVLFTAAGVGGTSFTVHTALLRDLELAALDGVMIFLMMYPLGVSFVIALSVLTLRQ